jgi:hypothetical protein
MKWEDDVRHISKVMYLVRSSIAVPVEVESGAAKEAHGG